MTAAVRLQRETSAELISKAAFDLSGENFLRMPEIPEARCELNRF